MNNLIKVETAVKCTECGLEICVWIEKLLAPLAIGGGICMVAVMLWKAVTA